MQRQQRPPLDEILDSSTDELEANDARELTPKIEQSLADFGIKATMRNIHRSPCFTQFSLKLPPDVQVAKVKQLEQDLGVALAGVLAQLDGPRPGYPYLTLTVENRRISAVRLRRVLEAAVLGAKEGELRFALGIDTFGQFVGPDLAALPHLLIGGVTGSGKSMCFNAIVCSLLCTYLPDQVRLLLIDPLAVELRNFNGLPHLYGPVITDTSQVLGMLHHVAEEIERRYQALAQVQARELIAYNQKMAEMGQRRLPYLVVMIDNLYDLMLNAPKELDQALTGIVQKARPVGVHLILATLRSNVATIAGSIKANFPARIAFRVADKTDSVQLLDVAGAEKFLGRGDMLYKSPNAAQLQRIQGVYLTESEITRIIDYWRRVR